MIDRIQGALLEKSPSHAVVAAGGIGLFIHIALGTYDVLPGEGEEVRLFTHLAVKEDDLTLYGFYQAGDREVFLRLIQVNGVGPRIAMAALSGLSARDLKQAIAGGDHKRLTSIPGIGKKMAERLVVELRDKFEDPGGMALPETPAAPSGPERDALLALIALGHKQQDARKMIENARKPGGGDSVEDLVRRALGGS
jgi:Holliday junction DNA helicase RuvA